MYYSHVCHQTELVCSGSALLSLTLLQCKLTYNVQCSQLDDVRNIPVTVYGTSWVTYAAHSL